MSDWRDMPCKEWTGTINQWGYGTDYSHHSSSNLAHRIAYEETYGPIPKGMNVCHHCDNPPCVEPLHLFLGTQADNLRDMVAKGRHGGKNKTHCVHGHEYTPENTTTHVNSRGSTLRECRTCIRERTRIRRQTERGKEARQIEYENRRAARAAARRPREGGGWVTFWQWINQQKERDDAVGDIARDIIADPTWPRRSWKLTTLMYYLESYAASPNAVRAFAQAWGEWHKGEGA
jgi:uncharacterized protein YozE (UPF0346 family)